MENSEKKSRVTPIIESASKLLAEHYKKQLNEQLKRDTILYGRISGQWSEEDLRRIEEGKLQREKERKELLDLLATAPESLQPVIELHSVDKYDECTGCDFGGWEGDKPAWPCRTIDIIAEHLKNKE